MNEKILDLVQEQQRSRPRAHRHRATRAGPGQTDDGFLCKHCHVYVSSALSLSGVLNRNHCPYCLWSRHLDLYEAGDRLSACKAPMQPIGLTVKATRKKYGPSRGELMLIHLCTECGRLSINRIAADDDLQNILDIFEGSFQLNAWLQTRLDADDIRALDAAEADIVRAQLCGGRSDLAGTRFQRKIVESF
jgi:hypothetical protein